MKVQSIGYAFFSPAVFLLYIAIMEVFMLLYLRSLFILGCHVLRCVFLCVWRAGGAIVDVLLNLFGFRLKTDVRFNLGLI